MADALYAFKEPHTALRSISHITTENGRYAFPAGGIPLNNGQVVALRTAPDRVTAYVCNGDEAAKLREEIKAGGRMTLPSRAKRYDLVKE